MNTELNIAIERVLFGDDLTGIAEDSPGFGYWLYQFDSLPFKFYITNIRAAENAWKDRDKPYTDWYGKVGKPYQADIEAHVANYRRPARNFCGSLDMVHEYVLPEIERGGTWMQALFLMHLRRDCTTDWMLINATPEQLCIAALGCVKEAT